MSYESWKAEYYPISARDVVARGASDRELVAHALREWRGLLPESLAARQINSGEDGDFIERMFYGGSCALCQKYYSRGLPVITFSIDTKPSSVKWVQRPCEGCPLARSLEGPCDEPSRGFKDGLYDAALYDPQIMVEVLEAVLEGLETADAD